MATIVDIAQRTRLPVATVRRILRGDNKESWGSTRERGDLVRRVAAELGYRRNTMAKATRTGRCGTIGLVLSDQMHRSDLPPALLVQLSQALGDHDLKLIVSVLPDERLTSDAYVPNILGELSCDGLLVNYHAHVPPRLEQLIEHYNIPAIWLNAKREYDALRPDDQAAGSAATSGLIKQGHRRIAYADLYHQRGAAHDLLHYSKEERLAGYRSAMLEANLEPEIWLPEGNNNLDCAQALHERASERLAASDRPTALVCYGQEELSALGPALTRISTAVASFGQHQLIAGSAYATTWRVPHQDIARLAVAMIERKIGSPKRRIQSQRVAFHPDPCTA